MEARERQARKMRKNHGAFQRVEGRGSGSGEKWAGCSFSSGRVVHRQDPAVAGVGGPFASSSTLFYTLIPGQATLFERLFFQGGA